MTQIFMRTEVPATEDGEPKIVIESSNQIMGRLRHGVSSYAAGLRELIGFGVSTDRDPAKVDELSEVLKATEDLPDSESNYMRHERGTLTPAQAELAHAIAATIFHGMERQHYESLATAWDDDRQPGYGGHGWHTDPRDIWRQMVEDLRPPEAPAPEAPVIAA
jgi:hypothetical protein